MLDGVDGEAASPEAAAPEVVSLRVPATQVHARLIRIGGASLAFRRGFPTATIDDLRLAIDEALILLLAGDGRHGTIDVTYRLRDGALAVEVARGGVTDLPPPAEGALDRFCELTSGLVDEVHVDPDARRVQLTVNRPA